MTKPLKFFKPLAICCIFGTSKVAMAQCPNGLIQEQTVEGDVIVEGAPCSIISSTINGDILVIDSDDISMMNNRVSGKVRLVRSAGQEGSGVANVIANTVLGGSFMIRDYAIANVIENETLIGSIRVYGNKEALVHKNIAAYNLVCRDNRDLSAFVNFARETLSCE